MEFDEKTQQYRPTAADITSDDIIVWLENCPISTFENPWFQAGPHVKTALEQNTWDPTVWDLLRFIRLELEPNPTSSIRPHFVLFSPRTVR